ncbi:hypothetical protein F5Y16DRAFT_406178 [Xylariaceae sp. FL0255]|nr:hypothetical protein F5Y16DRAFT_406178 [Xylariaceae sp. FL0255]
MISLLEFATEVLLVYEPTSESGLDALSSTLILDLPVKTDPTTSLIKHLHKTYVTNIKTLEGRYQPQPESKGIASHLFKNRKESDTERAKLQADRMIELWNKLRSLYPDKNWPADSKHDKEPIESSASPKHTFEEASQQVLFPTPFQAKEGHLGIGPIWLEDQTMLVFLVGGSNVPCLFCPAKNHYERIIEYLEKQVQKIEGSTAQG